MLNNTATKANLKNERFTEGVEVKRVSLDTSKDNFYALSTKQQNGDSIASLKKYIPSTISDSVDTPTSVAAAILNTTVSKSMAVCPCELTIDALGGIICPCGKFVVTNSSDAIMKEISKASSPSTNSSSSNSTTTTKSSNFAEVTQDEKKYTGGFSWWIIPIIVVGLLLILVLLVFIINKKRETVPPRANSVTAKGTPNAGGNEVQKQPEAQVNTANAQGVERQDIEDAINNEIAVQLNAKVDEKLNKAL